MSKNNRRSSDNRTLDNIYRGKLTKLCTMRYCNHWLPNNEDGRAMLTALLCFGLTDDGALADAPWSAAELPALKRRARRLKWRDVGKLINLKYSERETCGLWVLDCDVSRKEVQRRQAEKRKRLEAERKKRKRAERSDEREAMHATPDRRDAIMRILGAQRDTLFHRKPGVNPPQPPLWYQGWMPVPTLIKLAAKTALSAEHQPMCCAFSCIARSSG